MALGVFGKVSKFNNNDTQPWLSDIVLPSTPMIKKRGRPKGLTQTVIGLPKKRMRSSKCAPFQKKSSIEIECLILKWFPTSTRKFT